MAPRPVFTSVDRPPPLGSPEKAAGGEASGNTSKGLKNAPFVAPLGGGLGRMWRFSRGSLPPALPLAVACFVQRRPQRPSLGQKVRRQTLRRSASKLHLRQAFQ